MHRPPRILIVGDNDVEVLTVLKHQLEDGGLCVVTALSVRDALTRVASFWPDVILIAGMLPEVDGLEFARQVKKTGLPIILLTELGESNHEAAAIRELAADCVVTPCDPQDLYARIERVLHHNARQLDKEARLVVDDCLTLDLEHAMAYTPSATVRLTSTEARLLYHLAQNAGRPVPNDELMRRVWPASTSQALLRTTIARLRAKLEPDPDNPRYILSKRRTGYLLATKPSPPVLSRQQMEVLHLVAQGYTDNQIAVALGLSSKTISAHVKLIRKALAANSRAHAVALAMHHGLLKISDANADSGSTPRGKEV